MSRKTLALAFGLCAFVAVTPAFASPILNLVILDPVRTATFLEAVPITGIVTNTLGIDVPLQTSSIVGYSPGGPSPTALFYFDVPPYASVTHILWYFRVFPGVSNVGSYTYNMQVISSLRDANGQPYVSNFAPITINIVNAVPEPGTLGLGALGAVFILLSSRKRCRQYMLVGAGATLRALTLVRKR